MPEKGRETRSAKARKREPRKSRRALMSAKVDALFAEWDKPDSPGAALAVVKNGSVIYKRGYGSANLEYGIPITPSSIFHIASVSKQFTTMAVGKLAQEGKLSLDDEVRAHIPEVPDFGKPITLRHLIHHTSGMRDQWELLVMAGWRMDDVITRAHILKMVSRQVELNFDPGEEHLYCNTGYTLLAETVERVSGQSFREWTEANFFKPLGMTRTHFHDDHEMLVKNRAYSYAPKKAGGFKKSVLNYANVGATSLFTTVEDLARWVRNFEDGRVGGPSVLKQMHEQGVLNSGDRIGYAFGLAVGQHRGLRTVGHGGADAGYRSALIRFPDQRFAVIILSNLSAFDPGRLALQVADIYLADHYKPLTEFAGGYYSEELDTTYTIEVRDSDLMARHSRHDDVCLTPGKADEFEGDCGWLQQIRFTRNNRKRITGFRLTGGRVRNLWFERR